MSIELHPISQMPRSDNDTFRHSLRRNVVKPGKETAQKGKTQGQSFGSILKDEMEKRDKGNSR